MSNRQNMESREEILRALQTIQNVCKENKCCDTCPFERDGWCMVQDRDPADWKFRTIDTWKAFEDLNVGDLMHFSIKLSHTASGSCGRKQAYVICKNLKTGVESKYTLNQIERPMANYEWEELK